MKTTILFTALLVWTMNTCQIHAQETNTSKDNLELLQMYENDQSERKVSNPDWIELNRRDAERRQRVTELIASEKVKTAKDYYHAAMIFQHGTDTIDSGKAVAFMKKAVRLDPSMNKWLLAAAIDRDLMRKGEPQIYGTQYVKNGMDQPFELYELDSTKITDAERREYNVRTLAEQRQQVIAMNKKSLFELVAEGKSAQEIVQFIKEQGMESEYNLDEMAINGLGYHFMEQDDIQDALQIFELNIELYPKAPNTYDSYGEALLKIGKEREAIKAYKKALELNPENENAQRVLKELQP